MLAFGRRLACPRKLARNRGSVLHILVTTPESLYLLLTADRSREILRTVRTMIVDEATALFVAITASLDRRPLATLLPARHPISVYPAGALRD